MSNTILNKNKNPAPEYCYILRDGTSNAVLENVVHRAPRYHPH